MSDKKEIYKLIKYLGIISFIPIILVSGPLAGYLLGSFLIDKFNMGNGITFVLIIIGLIAGIYETISIIIKVKKMERKM